MAWVDLTEEAAYSLGELDAYERHWDAVSVERTLLYASHQDGLQEGREIGRKEGRAAGIAEGRKQGKIDLQIAMAKKLISKGRNLAEVAELTELSIKEVQSLHEMIFASKLEGSEST